MQVQEQPYLRRAVHRKTLAHLPLPPARSAPGSRAPPLPSPTRPATRAAARAAAQPTNNNSPPSALNLQASSQGPHGFQQPNVLQPDGLQGLQGSQGLHGLHGLQSQPSDGLHSVQGFQGQQSHGLHGVQGQQPDSLHGSDGLEAVQASAPLIAPHGLRASQGSEASGVAVKVEAGTSRSLAPGLQGSQASGMAAKVKASHGLQASQGPQASGTAVKVDAGTEEGRAGSPGTSHAMDVDDPTDEAAAGDGDHTGMRAGPSTSPAALLSPSSTIHSPAGHTSLPGHTSHIGHTLLAGHTSAMAVVPRAPPVAPSVAPSVVPGVTPPPPGVGIWEKLGAPVRPLRMIIIGHNPSETTWRLGHAYAHPSNHMWRLLIRTGIAPSPAIRGAQDDDKLPGLAGVGFSDVGTGHPGTQSNQFKSAVFVGWSESFYTRMRQHMATASAAMGCTCGTCGAPTLVAFSGKRQFMELLNMGRRGASKIKTVPLGLQDPQGPRPNGWPFPDSTEIWVCTSTSGAAVLTNEQREAPYRAVAERLTAVPWPRTDTPRCGCA